MHNHDPCSLKVMPSITFPLQTGYFSYAIELVPYYTTGKFELSFFNSGQGLLLDPNRVSLSGESGKLFDQDANFIHSYISSAPVSVSGNVFPTYQNIFVNQIPKNLDCSRKTGFLSGFSIDLANFEYATLSIKS